MRHAFTVGGLIFKGSDGMKGKLKRIGMVGGLLMVTMLMACTQTYYGYPGTQLPESKTALLVPDVGVKIYSINDHVVNIKHESESDLMMTTRAILLPGSYRIVVVPQHIKTVKTFSEIRAKLGANRQYRVRIRRNAGAGLQGREYEFWVENMASGQVVSDIGTSVNPFRQ